MKQLVNDESTVSSLLQSELYEEIMRILLLSHQEDNLQAPFFLFFNYSFDDTNHLWVLVSVYTVRITG